MKDIYNKQSTFAAALKNFYKGVKTIEKKFFLNNWGFFLSAREKVLNNFESRLFSIKNLGKTSTHEPKFESAFQPAPEPTPETTKATKETKTKTKRKISQLKLREQFLSESKN